jgi:hypothetical protein
VDVLGEGLRRPRDATRRESWWMILVNMDGLQ